MKFGFIAKHRGIWPTAWLCEALGVSRGGFYAWLTRPRSASALVATRCWAPRSGQASCRVTGPTARDASGTTCWPREWRAACIGSSD